VTPKVDACLGNVRLPDENVPPPMSVDDAGGNPPAPTGDAGGNPPAPTGDAGDAGG
jgi:hypothetical protein